MTDLHLDLSPDLGGWRNISIHTRPLVSVRMRETKDILALCWCPGVVVFLLEFFLHIFYKQPQRILSIRDILQCDFCMVAKMSDMDVN